MASWQLRSQQEELFELSEAAATLSRGLTNFPLGAPVQPVDASGAPIPSGRLQRVCEFLQMSAELLTEQLPTAVRASLIENGLPRFRVANDGFESTAMARLSTVACNQAAELLGDLKWLDCSDDHGRARG